MKFILIKALSMDYLHDLNLNFDFNRRYEYVLGNLNLDNKMAKRVIDIVLPFLNLYKPAQSFIGLSSASYQVSCLAVELNKNMRNWDFFKVAKNVLQTAVVVVAAVTSVFAPSQYVLVSGLSLIISNLFDCAKNLWAGNYAEADKSFYQFVNQALHLASLYDPRKEVLLLSLMGQIIMEVGKSVKEYRSVKENKRDRLPEAIANALMACIRIYEATPYAQKVYRDHFGQEPTSDNLQELTPDNLKEVLSEVEYLKIQNPDQLVDFHRVLKDRNLKNKVRDISFSPLTMNLSKVKFENIRFTNCDFSQILLSHSSIAHSIFDQCDLSGVDLFGSSIVQTTLNQCNLYEADCRFSSIRDSAFLECKLFYARMEHSEIVGSIFKKCFMERSHFNNAIIDSSGFYETFLGLSDFYKARVTKSSFNKTDFSNTTCARTVMENVTFDNSNLTSAVFNESDIKGTTFLQSNLREASFFLAQVSNSQFPESDLTDCISHSGKVERITKPIIGLLWDFELGGAANAKYVDEVLKELGANVLKVDFRMNDIDYNELDKEVDGAILHMQSNVRPNDSMSIGERIITQARPNSQIALLVQKCKKLGEIIHGLVLPGGSDIEPKFYGEQASPDTDTELDTGRTLLELTLTHLATRLKIPTLGICRGFQLLNTFFSRSKLLQNVDNHFKVVHVLRLEKELADTTNEVMSNILNGSEVVLGLSMHHQAINVLGDGFECVMRSTDGIVKAAVSKIFPWIFGTQFHPEAPQALFSSIADNRGFFAYLIQLAKVRMGAE